MAEQWPSIAGRYVQVSWPRFGAELRRLRLDRGAGMQGDLRVARRGGDVLDGRLSTAMLCIRLAAEGYAVDEDEYGAYEAGERSPGSPGDFIAALAGALHLRDEEILVLTSRFIVDDCFSRLSPALGREALLYLTMGALEDGAGPGGNERAAAP